MKLSTSLLLVPLLLSLCGGKGGPVAVVQPVYGRTNPSPEHRAGGSVKRLASIVELRPEKEQYYRELHANVWPEVVAAIKQANIQNYSIFVGEIEGKKYLFSYLEYTGQNAERDFAMMAEDATTKNKWWPETDPCQKRLPGTPEGEQWLGIEMLMHID